MVTMACFYFILIFCKDLQKYMTSDTNSNGVLTRKEKEELVLDLYFNQNKTYHEIAKIARMSPRDIKPIIDKAINEKERQAHKSLSVQAYELFYKGKTLLEVTIDLNLGLAQATAYYGEYLKLVGLDNITKIYQELQGGVWYFVKLCKDREIQTLDGQITDRRKELEAIKSECRGEAALLEGLRQQTAKVQAFVYNYKNNNEEYVEVIKSIGNKVHDFLSDKKKFLNAAIISLIESMRNDPEKYSALVYHNNENQNSSSRSKDHDSN